jgi:hypothetical protein
VEQAMVVKDVLDNYERCTGQQVSLGKCSILFGEKCSAEAQASIKGILKYETTCFEEKYLGLPIPEGRLKKGKFQPLKERFKKKATDWAEKYMSSAAKGTLITSVLQSLPTYAMGIFKFPAGLLEELTKIVRDFWWGDEENRRRMHWMVWDRLARPKYQGGVGFRDLKVFNQALLARQAWRLIQFPDSLCARLLKARYYPSGNLLDTAFIQNSSTTWQGIIYGLELLKKGVVWRIGNGSSVRIFRDNWLPRVDDPKVAMKRRTNRRRWVSELINPDTRSWDERLIREISYAHDADMILSIKLPMTPCDDFVAWLPEKNGMFTVSSAYRLGLEPALIAMSPGQSSSNPTGERRIWDLVWKAKVPLKPKVFAWKAATETLAVKVAVHRRISTVLPTCTTCGCSVESVHHALVTCTLARALREGM